MKVFIKINLLFLIAFFAIAFGNSKLLAEEINNEVKKDIEYYKYEQYNDKISCLKPSRIEGIDKVYVKQDGELLYLIEITGFEGFCSFEASKILFKRGTPQDVVDRVLKKYTPHIEMEMSFVVTFNVKKMSQNSYIKLRNKEITIPYFVVINNRLNNNILQQNDYKITFSLPRVNSASYQSSEIKIKQDFSVDTFSDMEVLAGIYFKNSNK